MAWECTGIRGVKTGVLAPMSRMTGNCVFSPPNVPIHLNRLAVLSRDA